MDPSHLPPPFRLVDSVADIAALAEQLCSPPDTSPTLVVTAVNRTREVPLDLARVAEEVGDAAHLVAIIDPHLTRALTERMPDGTTPYNGAARIYPAHDLTWMRDCFAGDLLFANIHPGSGTRVAGAVAGRLRTIAENAEGYAALAERSARAAQSAALTPEEPRRFRGGFSGASSPTVGMITSPDAPGTLGMLRVDLDRLLPGAPVTIGSVFAEGDEVSGLFDADGAVVSVDGMRTAAQMAGDLARLRCYPAVATAVVAKSQVQVQVVPGVASVLTRTGIDTTAEPGDVVGVQVQSVSERDGSVKIVVGPSQDAEVLPAPPVRAGGPPWVTATGGSGGSGGSGGDGHVADTRSATEYPGDPERQGDPGAPGGPEGSAGAADRVPPGSVAELEGLRARVPKLRTEVAELNRVIDQLHDRLDRISRENDHSWEENDRLTDENERLQATLRRSGVSVPTTLPGAGKAPGTKRRVRTEVQVVHTERPFIGNEFTDLSDQLGLEIRVEWARRVDAGEKAAHPLRFHFGEEFLDSVTRVVDDGEPLRRKLPRVMMWVASGYEDRTTRPHQFRISDAGGAPYLVRDDRAKAYRVDLETNTAAARRLHYWKLVDGTVEFQRVCFHDEPGF